MKKIYRLTESDLHNIINNSVARILRERREIVSERIKSEKGMSDNEVLHRRRENFMKDMDAYHKDQFSPNYSDRIEMETPYRGEEEMNYRVDRDRLAKHRNTQNHKKNVEESVGQTPYGGVNDEWYQEEDYNGNIGEEGMVRSYDIGAYYDGNAEQDARENGFDNIEDWLRYYFDEIRQDCPWYWTKTGSSYGYNGETIFRDGQLVCKNIYGQIMFDEYPIGAAEYGEDFNNRLNRGEYYAK